MSFLEWWGERADPGTVGRIEVGAEHEACTCRPLVWARFLLVMFGLPILWTVVVSQVPLPTWQAWAAVVGITLLYVGFGYLLNPEPDMDNLGWCGGMIDHPWRYSDDMNRSLLGLQIVLGPGRFVAESVIDWFGMLSADEQTE